jgi:hypothetical protein
MSKRYVNNRITPEMVAPGLVARIWTGHGFEDHRIERMIHHGGDWCVVYGQGGFQSPIHQIEKIHGVAPTLHPSDQLFFRREAVKDMQERDRVGVYLQGTDRRIGAVYRLPTHPNVYMGPRAYEGQWYFQLPKASDSGYSRIVGNFSSRALTASKLLKAAYDREVAALIAQALKEGVSP